MRPWLGREQPAVHGGVITPRTILHVTVLIDHDVVDGTPTARFVADAVRRLEGRWARESGPLVPRGQPAPDLILT